MKNQKIQIQQKLMLHHESCVVEVPGVGRQAPVDRVHDGVLDDVHKTRHTSGEEPLCPARQPVGLLQEASGEEPMVHSYLSIYNILCENMGAG